MRNSFSANVVELQNVSKIYQMDGISIKALENVSLIIKKGEFLSLVGPSGSGKSTLVHIIGLLDRPSLGNVFIDDEKVNYDNDIKLAQLRNKKIGLVFQSFNLLPRTSALANVELPLIYAGIPEKERHLRAKQVLEEVGLGHRFSHLSNQLSGGEKQRVAIARALVNNPSLILADEPTGNLDSKTGKEILDILSDLNNKKNTIILVTHEKEIAKITQKIIILKDGRIS